MIKSPWSPAVVHRTIKNRSSKFGVRGVWICSVSVLLMFQQSSSLFLWVKFQTKDVAENSGWNYVNESRRPCRLADVCDCRRATEQRESVCSFTGIVKDQIAKARSLGIKCVSVVGINFDSFPSAKFFWQQISRPHVVMKKDLHFSKKSELPKFILGSNILSYSFLRFPGWK